MEMNVVCQNIYIEQNGSAVDHFMGIILAHMWDCLMETVNNQDFLFCAFPGNR